MRAERFGSYSTVDTLPGMSFLSRLKSMMRYSRRWPPPRHHDVRCPWLLRPPDRCRFSVRGAYGSFVVMSSNVSDVLPRTPGEVGLYLRMAMVLYAPCRNSGSFSPSRSFTYAFFQSARRPMYLPWRFILPCASEVRTLSTLDPSSCSTARLMSILLASFDTWKTSVRSSSRMRVVFSVMMGRRMTSVTFIRIPNHEGLKDHEHVFRFRVLRVLRGLSQRLLELLERGLRQHDAPRIHHVAGAHAVARQHAHALDVPHRQRQPVLGLHVHEEGLAVDPEPPQHVRSRLGLDLADGQRIDDDHRAVAQLLRERRAQRALLDLLGDPEVVAARLRTERGAALAPQRVADLADAGTAGAFLPPRLLAGTAHHRARLGRVGAAALGGVGPSHRLVDQV